MRWPDDPSPDEDMDSDITFGAWLGTLTVEVVLRDLEAGVEGEERSRLLYLRQPKRTPGAVSGPEERRMQ